MDVSCPRRALQHPEERLCGKPVSLSSDHGNANLPITNSTICPSHQLFIFLSIWPLHSYSHSQYFLFLLSHLLPDSPYPFCSSFILSLPPSPPNFLTHFISLPLSFPQGSYPPVVPWVVEPHLHPIRLVDGAFCGIARWKPYSNDLCRWRLRGQSEVNSFWEDKDST